MQTAPQVIQLPQRLLRSILSRIRAELGDDDALSGHLQGQRGEDVLDIILFGEDELGFRLAQIGVPLSLEPKRTLSGQPRRTRLGCRPLAYSDESIVTTPNGRMMLCSANSSVL